MGTNAGHAGRMRSVRQALRRVRRTARSLMIARAAGLLVAVAVAGAVAAVLLDYALRLPGALRLALLAVAAAGAAGVVWRELVPALRYKPSLVDVALRLERRAREAGAAGAMPALSGLLASGLELERGGEGDAGLRETVAARAGAAFVGSPPPRIYRFGPPARAVAWALAAIALVWGGAAVAPGLARIGLARLVNPWSEAMWPARTDVEVATPTTTHRADEAFTLRAALVQSHRPAEETRVEAVYALESADGRRGPERRVLLTPQPGMVEAEAGVAGRAPTGRAFEKVLEPATLAMAGGESGDGAADRYLVFYFETEDDRTPTRRVLISEPPRLISAEVTATPPAYVARADEGPARVDALVSADGRVRAGPVLAGSVVGVTLRFSEPVELTEGADERLRGGVDGVVTAEVVASEALMVSVPVADALGLAPTDAPVLLVDTVADAEPSATVLVPAQDAEVLASAVIDLEAEGRDDIALETLALERALRPAQAQAPVRSDIAAQAERQPGVRAREQVVRTTLELNALGVGPGDEIGLVAIAQDGFRNEFGPREPVRSAARRLRIISEDELVAQLRGRLAGVARVARELDERQDLAQEQLGQGVAADTVRAAQSDLRTQIERQAAAVEALRERAAMNRLENPALDALTVDAQALAEEAGRAAGEAAESLSHAEAAAEAGATEAEAKARQDAGRQQDRVRDALGQLMERLAQGEDAYLTRRALERLLEAQRGLTDETAEAGAETLGRSPEQLSPEQRRGLADLAEAQRRLAEEAAEVVEQLEAAAEATAEASPAQAEGLAQAARTGRQQATDQKLEQAAEQIGQNQTAQAGQAQEAAEAALEEMLEQLDRAERNRDAALRRELASLIDSLRGLIQRQERELDRLGAVREGAAAEPPLAEAMIALHAATLDTAERAGSGMAEIATLQGLISDAADNQDDAVTLLRAGDALEAAGLAEQDALALLRQALEEAQRVDEAAANRERDRLRAELREAYAAALAEQQAIRGLTEPLVPLEALPRAQRAAARELSRRQDELRASLAETLAQTDALADSPMVVFVHGELEATMSGAAGLLREADVPPAALVLQDRGIALLRSLVEAFTPFQPDRDDEFGEDQQGGGAGQGQGGEPGLVEALAELRIMRASQDQLLGLTRALDEAGGRALGPYDTAAVAQMQARLAEQGRAVIESISGGGGGGGAEPMEIEPEVVEPDVVEPASGESSDDEATNDAPSEEDPR